MEHSTLRAGRRYLVFSPRVGGWVPASPPGSHPRVKYIGVHGGMARAVLNVPANAVRLCQSSINQIN